MKPNQKLTARQKGIWICITIAVVCVIWGGANWYNHRSGVASNEVGNYGSYLQGAVASPWALAGILLVFVAFLAQGQQIDLQRQELELQRQDLLDQKRQSDAETKLTKKRDFESTFFQLVNLQNQISSQMRITIMRRVNNTVTDDVKRVIEGRDCFEELAKELRACSNRIDVGKYIMADDSKTVETGGLKDALGVYIIFYEEYHATVGHYFRNLFQLLDFIKRSNIDEREKERYANLAVAQLSANELFLLFYHGLSAHGQQLKLLIEEYGLLQHLDTSFLLYPSHKDFYRDKGAWAAFVLRESAPLPLPNFDKQGDETRDSAKQSADTAKHGGNNVKPSKQSGN